MLWGCRFVKNRDQCTLTTGKNDRFSQANLSAFVDCCFNCPDHNFTILNRWECFNPLQTMPYLLAARLFSGNTKQMPLAADEQLPANRGRGGIDALTHVVRGDHRKLLPVLDDGDRAAAVGEVDVPARRHR